MKNRKFGYFFELPGELREQILAHVIVKPTGVHVGERHCFPGATGLHGDTESGEDDEGSGREDDDDDEEEEDGENDSDSGVGWPVNYFLVSQTFYREASSLFFGENTFHLYAGVRRSVLFDPLSDQGVLAPQGQQLPRRRGSANCGGASLYLRSRRRVKRVVLYIQRLGGSLGDVIAPCLQDMVLTGELRHLDVRVYHLEQQGADKREALWTSAPASILVRLLRDPDLETARLRAYLPLRFPRRLGAMAGWCPLRSEQGLGDSDPAAGQWASVDVEELSRRYAGGEASIRRAVEERSLLRWAGT
ncbi:hypothetical protein Daus18300_000637 [Diaporthe australafricana]|uniref:F-box domain-containing protein n=1 Tax=Diaporthe australafricana TaxID=127596 RepID=A0ABR3Y1I9_9PEZI